MRYKLLIIALMLMVKLPVMAQAVENCVVVTLTGVNLRSGPGTQFELLGSRTDDYALLADGQARDAEGYIWWRVQRWWWLREDIVREAENCNQLPVVTPDTHPTLAILALDNAARIQNLAVLEWHTAPVWGLSISADNRYLASGALDGTVLLWNLDDFSLVSTLVEPHETEINPEAVFSPIDSTLIAVGRRDQLFVNLLKIDSQEVLHKLEFNSPLLDVVFSIDGRYVYTFHLDGQLHTWNLVTGEIEDTVLIKERCIDTRVTLNYPEIWIEQELADTGKIMLEAYCPKAFSYNYEDYSPESIFSRHEDLAVSYDYPYHNNRIAELKQFYYGDEVFMSLPGVQRVAFSPDGRMLISAEGSTIAVWGVLLEQS